MGKKQAELTPVGKLIVYGNPDYRFDNERGEHLAERPGDRSKVVEILDVQEVRKDHIITPKYIIPLADAQIANSSEGIVYTVNAFLPYLTEAAHLAEVEKSLVFGNTYVYQGRKSLKPGASPPIMWLLVVFLGLMAIVGMFK